MGPNFVPTLFNTDAAQADEDLVADGLVTVAEAAKFLSLSRATLYQLMDQGQLPYVKIGKSPRVPRKAVIELAAKNLVVR
jgi:excisionase family DNA binding protein